MKNLLQFIIRFHFAILFVLIELVCLLLVVRYNNYHNVKFLNSSNSFCAVIYSGVHSLQEYFSLAQTNEELARENARLHNLMESSYRLSEDSILQIVDTAYRQQYLYRWAQVINNTVNRQQNNIILNRGRKQGIEPEMGVVTPQGVVGIVRSVSDNYATVISLLNKQFRVSAKIRKNGYFGSLTWDGKDYRKARLYEIPYHVPINIGDTIETSSYSAIFPEGVLIGTVCDYKRTSGGNFHDIVVELSVDFKSLSYVEVVGDLLKEERLELENRDL